MCGCGTLAKAASGLHGSMATDRRRGEGVRKEQLTVMQMVRSGRVGVDRNGGNQRRTTTTYATKTGSMASTRATSAPFRVRDG